ncbi:MAG: hypothetical protein HY295_06150 [Thaumarchaeota archaeon]|nr:hypothetical protein [Nitrososphaerota archaeon]
MSGGGNSGLDAGILAIRLTQIFTVIYTNGMQSIQLKNKTDPDYQEKIDAWTKAFQFTQKLQSYVNDLSSMISDAGQSNTTGSITVTQDFVVKLQNVLNSDDFKQNMNTAKPNTADPNLLKVWCNAFTFPGMLQNFANSVEHILGASGGSMPFFTFLSMLKAFLDGVDTSLNS